MLNLLRNFNARLAHYQDYKRSIERQKLLIDPQAIVLIAEFNSKAAIPHLDKDTQWGKFVRGYHAYAMEHLEEAYDKESIQTFDVPFKACDPEIAHEALRIVIGSIAKSVPGHEGGIDHITNKEISDLFVSHTVEQGVYEDLMFPAVYVGDIFDSFNAVSKMPNLIGHYESRSLVCMEGKTVLDFWKTVQSLKDYSGLFPDKPKPTGNRPDDRGGKSPSLIWQPKGI